jgi:hypothetical protein
LRTDGVWTLDSDVPMDRLRPLDERRVTGRLQPTVEAALLHRPDLVHSPEPDLSDASSSRCQPETSTRANTHALTQD